MPLLGDLHRRSILTRATHANSSGMFAAVPKGGAPTRTDPAAATVMPLGLFRQRLLKTPHQFVDIEMFEGRAHLVGEFFEGLRIREPVEQFRRKVDDPFDSLEIMGEDLVECVEVTLALDETRPCDVVETLDSRVVQSVFEAREQHSPLLQSDLEARIAQRVEEVEEDHLTTTRTNGVRRQAPRSSKASCRLDLEMPGSPACPAHS